MALAMRREKHHGCGYQAVNEVCKQHTQCVPPHEMNRNIWEATCDDVSELPIVDDEALGAARPSHPLQSSIHGERSQKPIWSAVGIAVNVPSPPEAPHPSPSRRDLLQQHE